MKTFRNIFPFFSVCVSFYLSVTFVRWGESFIGNGWKCIDAISRQQIFLWHIYSIIFQRLSTAVIVPIQSVLIFSGR